jgi:hypothetical protein
VIVRVLGEGQLEIDDDAIEALNVLDDKLVAAIDAGDSVAFSTALEDLIERVRREGSPVPDDYLAPSDLVLPGPDATLGEVRDLLSEEGLIPD